MRCANCGAHLTWNPDRQRWEDNTNSFYNDECEAGHPHTPEDAA